MHGTRRGTVITGSLLALSFFIAGCAADVLNPTNQIEQAPETPAPHDDDPLPPPAVGEDWSFSRTFDQICGTAEGKAQQVPPVDVMFLVDTSGSMNSTIHSLQLEAIDLAAALASSARDVHMAVARFEDYPGAGEAYFNVNEYHILIEDVPYELMQPLTSDLAAVNAAIDELDGEYGFRVGGGDAPESLLEALYQAATGEGFQSEATGEPGPGQFGAVAVPATPAGWRAGALKTIIVITDAALHDPDTGEPAPPGAHGWTDTVATLNSLGAQMIGISVGTECCPDDLGGDCPAFCNPDAPPEYAADADLERLLLATGGTAPDGVDRDGDGSVTGDADIPPGGALIFRVLGGTGMISLVDGEPLHYDMEELTPLILSGVDTILATYRIRGRLAGADAGTVRSVFTPAYYDNVPAGEQVCFELTVSGTVAAGETPRALDLEAQVVEGAGTILSRVDVSFTPTPP